MGKIENRIMNFIFSVFFCVLALTFPSSVYADEVISKSTFNDEDIYKYLSDKYDNNANGQLEKSELESVNEFILYADEVFDSKDSLDMDFLKYMPNLTYLEIRSVNIENLEMISELNNLEHLCLNYCGLTSISFVTNMNNLRHLDVGGNAITDLYKLTSLRNSLTVLYIGNYKSGNYTLSKSDIEFLSEMNSLQLLAMLDSGLTELPDLTGLVNLTGVSLTLNSIYKSEAFEKLPINITSRENWINETGLDYQQGIEDDTFDNVANRPEDNNPEENTVGNEQESTEGEENLNYKEIAEIYADFGIKMYGAFGSDVYVIAKEIIKYKDYNLNFTGFIGKDADVKYLKMYDITVYDKLTNKKVQPIGAAKVNIQLDGTVKGNCYVFRLEDNGEWVEMASTMSDGEISFYSDHFSIYSVVITELAEKIMSENESLDDSKKIENKAKISIFPVVAIIVICMTVCGVCILISKLINKLK